MSIELRLHPADNRDEAMATARGIVRELGSRPAFVHLLNAIREAIGEYDRAFEQYVEGNPPPQFDYWTGDVDDWDDDWDEE